MCSCGRRRGGEWKRQPGQSLLNSDAFFLPKLLAVGFLDCHIGSTSASRWVNKSTQPRRAVGPCLSLLRQCARVSTQPGRAISPCLSLLRQSIYLGDCPNLHSVAEWPKGHRPSCLAVFCVASPLVGFKLSHLFLYFIRLVYLRVTERGTHTHRSFIC